MVAVHHVGRCRSRSTMKHWLQLGFLICSLLIQAVSTARGGRVSRSTRYSSYYKTTGGSSGDDDSWIYIVAAVLGVCALCFCGVGICLCYVKLKERRARMEEEAKELEQKNPQNMQQKRSRNVVGTAQF